MNKTTILQEHLEFKKTSVKAEGKLKDIERYLSKFINSNKKPLEKFEEQDVIKFLNSLEYSIRTMNDIRTYIKVFVKWNYPDYSSRFRNLDKICKQQRPSKAYTPEQMVSIEEVEKIIAGEQDLMYKVYWALMFYGGFRPSECAGLLWNQILFEDEGTTIKIHTTKTNKDFYKSIPKEVEHLLKEWKKYNCSEYLFPSPVNEGDCIKARSICGRLKRLSKRVLGKKVVPYALRHSIATILYKDDTRKDDDTAHQLGHSKSMKETYLNLDEDSLKARARKLWLKTKPLTPEEKNELKALKERMNKFETLLKQIVKASADNPTDMSEVINMIS